MVGFGAGGEAVGSRPRVERRALPHRRAARAGRHGLGLPGLRGGPRPLRGAQGAAAGVPARPRLRRALRARGQGHREARAPEHRPDLHLRHRPRPRASRGWRCGSSAGGVAVAAAQARAAGSRSRARSRSCAGWPTPSTTRTRKGIVHRDVKPQNVLLDEDGRVYLADFGIAKMLESSGGLTATGMITGTPQYMAPEQATGTKVGPPGRRLRARHRGLRDVHRPRAVRRRHARRDPDEARAGAAAAPAAGHGARAAPARDPQVHGQEAGGPLAERGRLRGRARGRPRGAHGAADRRRADRPSRRCRRPPSPAAARRPLRVRRPAVADSLAVSPRRLAGRPRVAAGSAPAALVGLGGRRRRWSWPGRSAWPLLAAARRAAAGAVAFARPVGRRGDAASRATPRSCGRAGRRRPRCPQPACPRPRRRPGATPPRSRPRRPLDPDAPATPTPGLPPAPTPTPARPAEPAAPAVDPEVQRLAAALADKDPAARRRAAQDLASLGPEAAPALPALTAALGDRTPDVRLRAAEALGRVGPPAGSAVPALAQALRDADPMVRAEAAKTLGLLAEAAAPAAVPLGEALASPDVAVRREAAKALARVGRGAEPALRALVAALEDKDKTVRAQAARALGRIGPPASGAVPALTAMSRDSDVIVSREARTALESIGRALTSSPATSAPAVCSLLREPGGADFVPTNREVAMTRGIRTTLALAVALGSTSLLAQDDAGQGAWRESGRLRRVAPRRLHRRGRPTGLPGARAQVQGRGRGEELRLGPPRLRAQGEGHAPRRRGAARP